VGSALVRRLKQAGYEDIVTATHGELNLTREDDVDDFFMREKPKYVILAAARVGGIKSNDKHEADFLLDNLKIQNNVISAAHNFSVKKLLFLGSACVYPKHAPQPVKEDALLTGPLEPSNQWYALAKIAGLKLCQAYRRQHGCDFISCMPCNLYGPGDHYDPTSSHVLPALIRKLHEAAQRGDKSIVLWGDGTPRREFLYSDDMAYACITLMQKYSGEEPVNIGTGSDIAIWELAKAVAHTVQYYGCIEWSNGELNGTPSRLLDNSKLCRLGWSPSQNLQDGLRETYRDFQAQAAYYDSMR
jgi:GDP-L-fucose synthase